MDCAKYMSRDIAYEPSRRSRGSVRWVYHDLTAEEFNDSVLLELVKLLNMVLNESVWKKGYGFSAKSEKRR